MRPEAAVGGERLDRGDVEGGEADAPGVQRVEERGLVDHRAAADVHEDRALAHGAEHVGADEAARALGAGERRDDRVGSAAASTSSSMGTSRSTCSTGAPVRVVPQTVAPSAEKRSATTLPMPPTPTTSTVISPTWRIVRRPSEHSRAAWSRSSRRRSFTPASTPKSARSASVEAWTPALVVTTTRSSSSSVSCTARTCPPPPAAVVCTQRRRGFARTVRARAVRHPGCRTAHRPRLPSRRTRAAARMSAPSMGRLPSRRASAGAERATGRGRAPRGARAA